MPQPPPVSPQPLLAEEERGYHVSVDEWLEHMEGEPDRQPAFDCNLKLTGNAALRRTHRVAPDKAGFSRPALGPSIEPARMAREGQSMSADPNPLHAFLSRVQFKELQLVEWQLEKTSNRLADLTRRTSSLWYSSKGLSEKMVDHGEREQLAAEERRLLDERSTLLAYAEDARRAKEPGPSEDEACGEHPDTWHNDEFTVVTIGREQVSLGGDAPSILLVLHGAGSRQNGWLPKYRILMAIGRGSGDRNYRIRKSFGQHFDALIESKRTALYRLKRSLATEKPAHR